MAMNTDFLEDMQKQLEKFSQNFLSYNPFLSWPSAGKNTCYQFQHTNIAIVNKNGSLFLDAPRHKYMFWLFAEMLKIVTEAL